MGFAARRVVVTGIGVVSPLGVGVETVWSRLLAGRSGVVALNGNVPGLEITDEEVRALPVQIASVVPRGSNEGDYDPIKVFGRDRSRELSRFIEYAVCASDEALRNAKFDFEELQHGTNDRFGVAIASGIGSLEDTVQATNTVRTSIRKLSPHFVPKILVNLAAGQVSIRHNLRGPNHAVSTACAAGAHAIGDAFNFISFGYSDVMLAGGTESSINSLAIAGFSRLRALAVPSESTSDVTTISRPFDKDRSGFVLGEGATVLVLEELEHALKRGAPILAEVGGYGLSGDAHHITAPSEDGRGAIAAMTQAIQRSGLNPDDVEYVNAHATSTPVGDNIEARAVSTVFGDRGDSLLVSSCKGAVGHLLGAAGAFEGAMTVLSLRDGIIPHTLNLEEPAPAASGFQHVMHRPVERQVRAAVSNSFGFGGTNASVLFKQFKP